MPSKEKTMFELDNVTAKFRIMQQCCFEDFYLNFGLFVEFGLVLDDLQSNCFLFFMVEHLKDLPEGAMA